VAHGIQLVQDQSISVTKKSTNIIKEYRNYLWMTDKSGKILNEPEHTFSHSMDAIRYGLVSLIKKGNVNETEHQRLAAINSYINPNMSQRPIGSLKPDFLLVIYSECIPAMRR
jgi:hypothetical protein